MFAKNPGKIVRELERLIVDGEGTAGCISEAGEIVREAYVGDAPRTWIDLDGNADLSGDIFLVGQLLADDVVKRVVSEASFVHLCCRKNPRVGKDPLTCSSIESTSVHRQAGIERRFISPAVTAEPLGVWRLIEVDPF